MQWNYEIMSAQMNEKGAYCENHDGAVLENDWARIPQADKRKQSRLLRSAFSGSRFGAGGRLDSRCWAEPVGTGQAFRQVSGPLKESGVGPAPSGVVEVECQGL